MQGELGNIDTSDSRKAQLNSLIFSNEEWAKDWGLEVPKPSEQAAAMPGPQGPQKTTGCDQTKGGGFGPNTQPQ
jgi:hypothetical protein